VLSELQEKKLTRYFQVYDIDDNGRIAASDLERVVENVRVLQGAAEGSFAEQGLRSSIMTFWSALSGSADVDQDGEIDLDEWLAYWQVALESDLRYAEEVEAITGHLFTVSDTDEDGEIGPDEFVNFYGVFGLGANLARSVFVELDVNNDGITSREELLEVGRQFYRSDDPASPGNMLFGPYGM
jgi:Ca2+-binding EF-hand superfamily protein